MKTKIIPALQKSRHGDRSGSRSERTARGGQDSRIGLEPITGSVLLIGYGNPGRLDDGLGPALAEAATRMAVELLTVESCYQLAVEHAAQMADFDVVIFADADLRGPEPYRFERLQPGTETPFTTHHVEPATLLGLTRDLFGATPDSFLLGIRGYEFNDFGERLSPGAQKNLAAAECLLKSQLQT